MCFAPQRRPIFGHPHLQTWSEPLKKLTSKCASRHKGVHLFDIRPSKSGPNMVCFVHFDLERCFAPQPRALFPSHLARCLRTRRFSEPTFRPSRPTNHWKNTALHNFPNSSRTCIFFLLTLSLSFFFCSPLFFSSLFYSSLVFISPYCWKMLEVWLLNFLWQDITKHINTHTHNPH